MLSKEYALALFEHAKEINKVDVFVNDLSVMLNAFKKDSDIMRIMDHPKVSTSEKKDILNKIISDLDEGVLHFCYVLLDNGRFKDLFQIIDDYFLIVKESQNIMVVTATSAVELTAEEQNQIALNLEKKYGKKIEIIAIVNKNVIGGVKLEFDGKVLDDTLRMNIDDLKSNLM